MVGRPGALRADSRRRPETPRRGEGAGAGQSGSRAEAPERAERVRVFVRAPGGVYPRGACVLCSQVNGARGPCARVSVWSTPRAVECACGDRARDASEAPGAEKAPKY